MLLIDAGNSRIKWALSSADGLEAHGVAETGAGLPAVLTQLPAQRVMIGSVAGDEHDHELQAALRDAGHGPVTFATVQRDCCGLKIAYEVPARLGVDRWLAMLGGQGLVDGALCIADAGTALTVDAVTGDGQHLGGLIAPGTGTMMRAMLSDTARIGEAGPVDTLTAGDMFASDTGAAVAAGAGFAAAALIDRAVNELAERQDEPVTLLLTGGEAPALARLVTTPTTVSPDLVLRGLDRLAREATA
ncbi:MAG: type III pantothenate kinase [Pseudomonadota bacterium]